MVAAVAARRSNVEGHHVLGVYKKVRARMCRPRSVSHIRRTVIFTTSWTSRRTATTSSLQLISRTKAQRCNSRSQACYGGRTFRPLRLVRRTSAYSASTPCPIFCAMALDVTRRFVVKVSGYNQTPDKGLLPNI